MGLRCSLLGHDFGDTVVERDRDVRGEEIVVTERELRECRRCDAESIITENTEVRRKRPKDTQRDESPAGGSAAPNDTATDATPEEAPSLVEEAEESAAEREQAAEDAIILDETDSEPGPDETPATGDSPDEAQTTGESPDETPATGDTPAESSTTGEPTASAAEATDIDAPSESGPRETAPEDSDPEAPDEDGMITAEEQDVPGTEEPTGAIGDREGDEKQWHEEASPSEAETTTGDTVAESKWPNDPETADRSDQSGGDTGGGSVREPTDDSEFEFGDEETDSGPGDPSSGIASAGPIDTTTPPEGGLEGVLRCPACDFAVPIARSANRPGDICPECHAGYLAEER